MTYTRAFIENRLIIEMANKENMSKNYLQDLPLKNSQILEWYYLEGFIAALEWMLSYNQGTSGFHEYTSELKIKDVLANIVPHISSHKTGCECHACITNDVLQNFIKNQRGSEKND